MSKLQLSPSAYKQAQKCVHCGLCLPTCPTYAENGLEGDSPRGRIYFMKALADGRMNPSESVLKHLDLCLDCRACETACPSGVGYHEVIEETRAMLRGRSRRTFGQRVIEWITLNVMTRPTLLKLAILPARVLQKIGLWKPAAKLSGAILGPRLGKMQRMLPESGPLWPRRLQERYTPSTPLPLRESSQSELRRVRESLSAAKGPGEGLTAKLASPISPKITVGFLPGCVGSVLFNDVNRKAAELLSHLGCDVVVPRSQTCCGAIHHHAGLPNEAAQKAKRNIEVFEGCDRVVNAIAGCGAMLKEYGHLFRENSEWKSRADAFSQKTRDITELIAELELPTPPHRVEMTATYHDACHLAHAQSIRDQPRTLLALIPGLKLIPLPESELCCGAAGTYNLMQPEMSRDLGQRKVRNILATGATACVTGNVGCAMQIESEARAAGVALTVYHPVELLHRAYFGEGR